MGQRAKDTTAKTLYARAFPKVTAATHRRRIVDPTTLTLAECKQIWIAGADDSGQPPSCRGAFISQEVQRHNMITAMRALLDLGAYHPSQRVQQIALACIGALQLAAALETDAQAESAGAAPDDDNTASDGRQLVIDCG